MSTCLVSVGSNLGDPVAQVTGCVELLRQHPQIDVVAVSNLHKTKPVGGPPNQNDFLNAAVRIETRLAPPDLLAELQQIENHLGRVREERWGPRVIDLDLLLYGGLVLCTDELQLPHPRMAFRRFVIEPAREIAGDMQHPLIGWTVSQIATHLDSAPNYVAVAGIPGIGKTAVVRAAADRIPLNVLLDDSARTKLPDNDPVGIAAAETAILEQRRDALKAVPHSLIHDHPDSEQEPFTVSDFWFEQSVAYAECFLPNELQQEFTVAFDKLLSTVPQPKLLVVLERDLGKTGDSREIESLANLQQRIVERSQIPGRGPVLWLSAEDFSRAVEEIVAAIEAIQ